MLSTRLHPRILAHLLNPSHSQRRELILLRPRRRRGHRERQHLYRPLIQLQPLLVLLWRSWLLGERRERRRGQRVRGAAGGAVAGGGREAGGEDHAGRDNATKVGRRGRVVARALGRGAVQVQHEAAHHRHGDAVQQHMKTSRGKGERGTYLLAKVESTPRSAGCGTCVRSRLRNAGETAYRAELSDCVSQAKNGGAPDEATHIKRHRVRTLRAGHDTKFCQRDVSMILDSGRTQNI